MSTWILVWALTTGGFYTNGQEYPSKAFCEAAGARYRALFNETHPADPAMFQCVQKVNQ